jgi:AbrB family looped-hinge helix DNA binding protein
MNDITVSPKFQVVIPQKVREMLHVKPGQKMRAIAYDDKIILIPVRPIKEARGSLKGMSSDVQREEEDRV